MKKVIGFLLLLVVTISLAYAGGEVNDFDKICQVYTNAYQQESFKTLSASERANYINQKIKEAVQPGDALDTLQVIAQADPNEKYNLLKQAAEISIGKKWDCPAIKNADLSY
jgi:hypothetical protein